MKEATVPVPVIALIAGTRAAGGAGIGMLLADRLPRSQRRTVGLALLAVGVLTTIPLLMQVFGNSPPKRKESDPQPVLRFGK